MDGHFNRLAEAGLAVSAAEDALAAGAHQGAQDGLDDTDAHLEALRAAWPRMSPTERRVIGTAARGIRERRDAIAARLPRHRTLAVLPAEPDVEEEADPEGVAA